MFYRFARGPRLLFDESKVHRIEASVHALHGCDLSFVSGSMHLILRVRQESQARLVTTRFGLGVPDPEDLAGLETESAIIPSCRFRLTKTITYEHRYNNLEGRSA